MGGVAVVATLAMEAEVVIGRDEKGFEQVALCQRVQFLGYVDVATHDRHRSPESQHPVQVEGGDLRVVSLEVSEVEMVLESLLLAGEPHGLEECMSTVDELNDEFKLCPAFLLSNVCDGHGGHLLQESVDSGVLRPIQLISGDAQVEGIPQRRVLP